MKANELIEDEYYWLKDADGNFLVGKYYVSCADIPCFDICGWEVGEPIEKFKILNKIEKPHED